MGNDAELKILITGDATGAVSATQQASGGLNKLKIDTSDLSDETKRSLGMLEPAKLATDNLGKAATEAGEKVEGHGREVRHLANELGRMIGVSDLGALSMGKFGATVFAVGVAAELLKSAWESVQEGNKGAIDLQVHTDPALISAAAKAMNEFAEARKKIVEANNSIEAQAGREEKALDRKLQQLHQIIKAEQDEVLAALASEKDKMSPQEYERKKDQIMRRFAIKEDEADSDSAAAKIAGKEKEAGDLETDSAKKKAQADAMGTGNTDAQETAIANAEDAKAQLAEIKKNIELVQRLRKNDYEGIGGAVEKAKDAYHYEQTFGLRQGGEVLGDLGQQKAQAQATINLGKQAEEQQSRLEKKKAGLLTEAGTESGKAEVLRQEAGHDSEDLNTQSQTNAATFALSQARNAIGIEGAAEGNNTAKGLKDAQAALATGNQAVSQVAQALKEVGTSNKEAHDALTTALLHLAEENKRLTGIVKNIRTNNH